MNLFADLLSVFFSFFCPGCGSNLRKIGVCGPCRHQLTPRAGGRCGVCDLALGTPNGGHTCRRCLLRAPHFDHVFGIFGYDGPAGRAVKRGKYAQCPELLGWLGARAAHALPQAILDDPPRAVLPIPLHWRRRVRRRFDAPLWCAEPIARTLGVPLAPGILKRVRNTSLQTGLTDNERRRNVRNAFEVCAPVPDDVLLVDDVFTTGATADAAARCLKRAGCQRVRVLCCAYVDPDDTVALGDVQKAIITVA